MSEPFKKPNHVSPESYTPKTPILLNMMEETQAKDAEERKMFIQKYNAELVELDTEIKVVGLSFNKCKQTGLLEVNSIFDLYSQESFELQDHIKNLAYPQHGYAIGTHTPKDWIVGKGVTDVDGQDEIYGSSVIPAGRYIKVSWNAETFGGLVDTPMYKKAWDTSSADALLESHNLIADHNLYIEVYPHETCRVGQENGPAWGPKYMKASMTAPTTLYPEMYTLCAVKEKE